MRRRLGNAAFAYVSTFRPEGGDSGPPADVKPRLLLVDDERLVLDGLELHLRRKYDVVSRTSGAAALDALVSEGPFVAVISDLRMPSMSGIELLAEVRRRAPETTRVLLTGHADVSSAIAAVNEAAVHRFLTKPCAPVHLARALEEAVASASAAGPPSERVDAPMQLLGRQATIGTMVGSIGQEIADLVGSLSDSLDLVQAQVDRGEVPASEDIALISLVKHRLYEHTRAVRELARPHEHRLQELDVAVLVCATVDMLKKVGVLKTARTRIDLPHGALHIAADHSLIEGALINLLKNAVEALAERGFMGPGSGDAIPLITVGVEARGDGVVSIVVEDNGAGIPAENLCRVFQPYFTTKQRAGGTGLGLAIVAETVRQHGGTIEVESAPDEGARFTIMLPLADHPALDPRRSATGRPGASVTCIVARR